MFPSTGRNTRCYSIGKDCCFHRDPLSILPRLHQIWIRPFWSRHFHLEAFLRLILLDCIPSIPIWNSCDSGDTLLITHCQPDKGYLFDSRKDGLVTSIPYSLASVAFRSTPSNTAMLKSFIHPQQTPRMNHGHLRRASSTPLISVKDVCRDNNCVDCRFPLTKPLLQSLGSVNSRVLILQMAVVSGKQESITAHRLLDTCTISISSGSSLQSTKADVRPASTIAYIMPPHAVSTFTVPSRTL